MKRQLSITVIALAACHSSGESPTVVIPPPPSASASVTPLPPLHPEQTGATPSDTECKVDADCTWGEIGHEITKPADCMCLLGCPGLPQNKTTESRRSAQYHRFCKPNQDGQGHSCPIDDCAPPPPIKCVRGACGHGP